MVQHCLQSWEDSKIPIGHGPTPVTEGRTEEKLKEISVQEETIPQASSREMPKPNKETSHLLRDNTKKFEVRVNEGDTTEGDETNRLVSNLRETSTCPTAVKPERTTLTSALPAMVKAKPGPKHPPGPKHLLESSRDCR